MATTYSELLLELAAADERLVVLTAENRAAIRELPARLGDRFIDVGIAEMTLLGAAAGLALRGRIPVVHALATFLTLRAYEFARTDVGIAQAPVKMVGYVPGLFSEANGPTHQAIEDIAVMRQIPGFRIFCPSDREELLAGLPSVLSDSHPWYIRYNDMPARLPHTQSFAVGWGEWTFTGTVGTADVAILTYGLLAAEAHAAAEILAATGLDVLCLNLRTLSPIDESAILRAAESRLVVTVEDHLKTGGLYSQVCEIMVRWGRQTRVQPIGLNTWFRPGLMTDVIRHEGFDAESIAKQVRACLAGSLRNRAFKNQA